MIYLMNSPVITDYGLWRFSGPIEWQQARQMIGNGYESAIGHDASAAVFSYHLRCPIPVQRILIHLQPGDSALVMRILQRLPAGMELDQQALAAVPSELGIMERIE